MVGFIFLCYRFLEPVAEFTEILDQTQTAVAGWRRVLGDPRASDHDHRTRRRARSCRSSAPSIELDHVTFRYRPRPGQRVEDNKPALRDVTFSIEPGTAVAVVGATGSGKTTLARLLTRLADPDEGAVRIAGIDLRDVSMASLRRSLVMVPQEPFLYDTTIADNVRFGRPSADDEDVMLAFTELGLEDWIGGLGAGLDTKVGERGDALSAGERQLVALARAYVANPPCLVLDEATSSVDALTETRLARALDSLARGRTSVTIAHRLSTASRADSASSCSTAAAWSSTAPTASCSPTAACTPGLYASWLGRHHGQRRPARAPRLAPPPLAGRPRPGADRRPPAARATFSRDPVGRIRTEPRENGLGVRPAARARRPSGRGGRRGSSPRRPGRRPARRRSRPPAPAGPWRRGGARRGRGRRR